MAVTKGIGKDVGYVKLLPKHIQDIDKRLIGPGKKRKKVKPAMVIDGVAPNGKKVTRVFLNKGGGVCLYGQMGCRKSFTKDLVMSAFHKKGKNPFGLRSNLTDPVVLDVDTEQPEGDSETFRKRYTKYCGFKWKKGKTIPNYYCLNVVPYTCDQRVEMISTKVAELRPDILVIDQVADLVYGENNDDSVQKLKIAIDKWRGKYGCSIIFLMHSNRQGLRTNGKVGSMIDKVCLTMLRLFQKNPAASTKVYPVKTRLGPFKGWSFDQLSGNLNIKFLGYSDFKDDKPKKRKSKYKYF